jgi:hypothetical protein
MLRRPSDRLMNHGAPRRTFFNEVARMLLRTLASGTTLLGALLGSPLVLAAPPEPTVSVELTDDGFALVSAVAKDQFINHLTDAALPDQELEIPLVARALVSDITYSVNLASLAVTPTEGAVDVAAVIDNIDIDIGSIRFESWALPFIGSTCTGTSADLGNGQALPVSARLSAKVEGGKIQLGVAAFDFSLAEGQYEGHGPHGCVGPFDVKDPITEILLSTVVANARPLIELGVRYEIKKIVPKVADSLNALATTPKLLDVPDLFLVPATKLALTAQPTSLSLRDGAMAVELAVKIKKADEESGYLPPRASERGVLYGTLGIRPALVNDLMAALMADGTRPLPLAPSMHPLIEALTNRESMALLWPDLDATPTDDTLRVSARFAKAPTVATLDGGAGWRLDIPSLELIYQVKRDGEWMPYATLSVAATVDAAPTVEGGVMTLKVLGGTATTSSKWADGFVPVDPTFDQAKADETFQLVINFMAATDSPTQMELPVLNLAERPVTVDGLRIENDYAKLDLVGAE